MDRVDKMIKYIDKIADKVIIYCIVGIIACGLLYLCGLIISIVYPVITNMGLFIFLVICLYLCIYILTYWICKKIWVNFLKNISEIRLKNKIFIIDFFDFLILIIADINSLRC